jgi:hypothetical protein
MRNHSYARTRWHQKDQPTRREATEYHGNCWRSAQTTATCGECGRDDLAWVETPVRKYLAPTRRLPDGTLQVATGRPHACEFAVSGS